MVEMGAQQRNPEHCESPISTEGCSELATNNKEDSEDRGANDKITDSVDEKECSSSAEGGSVSLTDASFFVVSNCQLENGHA